MSIFEELWYTERYTAETINMDRFQNRYFEMKKLDKAQRAYEYRKMTAEPRSTIRERALNKTLERVRDPDFDVARALEPISRNRSLSPVSADRTSAALALRSKIEDRLRQQIRDVRRQDAAADAEELGFARSSPLQQARSRDGWYRRSMEDRNAAMLGLLQRERRQLAPLTREAVSRAKSIDASRGMEDPYVVTDTDLEKVATGVALSASYSAYVLTQRHRRETLFAQGKVIAGGYPGYRGKSKAQALQQGCE